MLWKLAAPLRVAIGVIRDELAVQRLQRRQERVRQAVPCYSNDDLDRMFRHAERAKRAA
jgi:hypothetical protein